MNDSLVTTQWLQAHLGQVKVLDASWYMPAQKRDAPAEFAAAHIPGAVYFDIDAVADQNNPLPHMIPSPDAFAAAVGAMGIGNDDGVVVYNGSGANMTALRAWWLFRLFGHEKVALLDGGMKAWLAEGRPTQSGWPAPTPKKYVPHFQRDKLALLSDVVSAVEKHVPQILDARAAERFEGRVPEPRPGLSAGHMPGARNLPFGAMVDPQTGLFISNEAIRTKFQEAGIDLGKPVITTCGSGVTACVLAFALDRVGHHHWSVYDGSWSEWGADPALPLATGPA